MAGRAHWVLISAICALACASACSHAAREPRDHSKAILILEQPVARPGSQVRVGVQFEMDKDWHIYWRNPGDSGEAPRVAWQLPAGVTAGDLAWPTPVRLVTSAGVDYGYQDHVVLLSAFNISQSVQPGTNLAISGDLRWLACHDTCIPQRAQLKANLRISDTATVDEHARTLLASASERLPKSLPESFHAIATSADDALQLSFVSCGKVAQCVFFPAQPEQIDNAASQELVTHGDHTSLAMKKSEHLLHPPERLIGVLVLNAQDSYLIDVPVRNSTAPTERQP